ncbi:MAG TPA: hypothetical protein VF519_17680 [Mycobacteriales bacterium]
MASLSASERAGGRLLAAALGLAAAAIAFGVAVTLGRGLAGGAAGPLLLPLAVSGALALGLGVTFVVASEVTQPEGAARARTVLSVVAPLATLIAFFAYSSDPGTVLRPPLSASPSSVPLATRPVSPQDPVLVVTDGEGQPGTPADSGRPPVAPGAGPRRPAGQGTAAGPRTVGPVRRVAAPVARPVVGPVGPVGPVARPVAAPGTSDPSTPVARPVRETPGSAPAVVSGEEPSVRSPSSGCPGRHRGWGRSRKAPRPRPCTKK